jgi:hypothetical protein
VPKVACTSLKTMLFDVENGFPFQPFSINGRKFWIHNFYHSVPFEKLNKRRLRDKHRVAVVRDPIQRALSCYSNRVVQHGELSERIAGERLKGSGLPCDPDLSTFVMNIARYSDLVAEIGHHAVPMVEFLGSDASYYHRIYRMSELDQFVADVSERAGRPMGLEVMQRSRREAKRETLSAAETEHLRAYYTRDYQVYGDYL